MYKTQQKHTRSSCDDARHRASAFVPHKSAIVREKNSNKKQAEVQVHSQQHCYDPFHFSLFRVHPKIKLKKKAIESTFLTRTHHICEYTICGCHLTKKTKKV